MEYIHGDIAALRAAMSNGNYMLYPEDFVEHCGSYDKADSVVKNLVDYGLIKGHHVHFIFTLGNGIELEQKELRYILTDEGRRVVGLRHTPKTFGGVTIH